MIHEVVGSDAQPGIWPENTATLDESRRVSAPPKVANCPTGQHSTPNQPYHAIRDQANPEPEFHLAPRTTLALGEKAALRSPFTVSCAKPLSTTKSLIQYSIAHMASQYHFHATPAGFCFASVTTIAISFVSEPGNNKAHPSNQLSTLGILALFLKVSARSNAPRCARRTA
ncbi:MAG: hypothetical protein OEL20_14155 [Sulfuritalea sp.]|nr:hypothetical protein [Sulfuritalea sp.]